MELDRLTKERYFSDLLLAADNEEDSHEEMSVDEESTTSDDPAESEEDGLEPLHSDSSLAPFPFNLTYCNSFSETEISSTDIDEDALTKELTEEDILDVLDIVQSMEYEKELWKTHR